MLKKTKNQNQQPKPKIFKFCQMLQYIRNDTNNKYGQKRKYSLEVNVKFLIKLSKHPENFQCPMEILLQFN